MSRPAARLLGPVLLTLLVSLLTGLAPGVAGPAAGATEAARGQAPAGRDFSYLPDRCYGRSPVNICRVTRYADRPYLVVWGDSHALMYLDPIHSLAREHRVNLIVMYSGGCPVSLPFPPSAGEPRMKCDIHNAAALDRLTELVGRPALSGRVRLMVGSFYQAYRLRYSRYLEARRTGVPAGLSPYERHVGKLGALRSKPLFRVVSRLGIPVDVLAQAPVPTVASGCEEGDEPYQCDLPRSAALPRETDNERWLAERVALLPGKPRTVDPSGRFCSASTCFAQVGGVDTWYDASHLGMRATRLVARHFEPSFVRLVRR